MPGRHSRPCVRRSCRRRPRASQRVRRAASTRCAGSLPRVTAVKHGRRHLLPLRLRRPSSHDRQLETERAYCNKCAAAATATTGSHLQGLAERGVLVAQRPHLSETVIACDILCRPWKGSVSRRNGKPNIPRRTVVAREAPSQQSDLETGSTMITHCSDKGAHCVTPLAENLKKRFLSGQLRSFQLLFGFEEIDSIFIFNPSSILLVWSLRAL